MKKFIIAILVVVAIATLAVFVNKETPSQANEPQTVSRDTANDLIERLTEIHAEIRSLVEYPELTDEERQFIANRLLEEEKEIAHMLTLPVE